MRISDWSSDVVLFRSSLFFTIKQNQAYQLALVTPGILPASAISRNVTREMPNWRIYPRGRPVSLQRLRTRTADELRGSLSSASQSPAAFRAALLSAYFSTSRRRFTSRAFMLSLAITDCYFDS